ncbi:uncharacterized protein LOC124531347 isoform X2 [Vanessa cardui]|uniref:uncharacterized protein LOC124531347 isoform X2 n=1 Tax=Vanessa cardui TaxID=171605 RepID=UPI001F14458A|nr:uncharacterized protein LOC124531347 isoform X2 [Vanessa cardui]XP_046961838.1 uncharacterized protein LOC124531347 isoform X2 [Vanessa cardui]
MSLCAQPQDDSSVVPPLIIIEEPDPRDCSAVTLPPEGNAKLRNYRIVNDNIRAYTASGDVLTPPTKGKLMSKFDLWSSISPPRDKILELLRPEDPGKDALEAIVRATPRRGLVRPYDEDTKRFLQRTLLNTSSTNLSQPLNSDPEPRLTKSEDEVSETKQKTDVNNTKKERSLADELREAEEDERSGAKIRRELLKEFRKRGGGIREAMERDRLGKLALAVEEDEDYEDCGLSAAARRLDALLVESRSLHEELAGIHEDMQVLARRVARRDH